MDGRRATKRSAIIIAALALTGAAYAAAGAKTGQALHDEKCLACHVKAFGGNGSEVYTRSPRLVYDRASLARRVSHCATQSGAGWLPEEEDRVTAYLNQKFYHFK